MSELWTLVSTVGGVVVCIVIGLGLLAFVSQVFMGVWDWFKDRWSDWVGIRRAYRERDVYEKQVLALRPALEPFAELGVI